MTEQRAGGPDPEVWALLHAAAAPAPDAGPLPGERAVLQAFRGRHLLGRRGAESARIRRGAGAVAMGVGLVLTSGTAAAAATGVLPGPAQHLAHVWLDRVGISVPDTGGFIERGNVRDHRGAELPDQAAPVSTPSSQGHDPLRRADDVGGALAAGPNVHHPGSRVANDHGSPPVTHRQRAAEQSGRSSSQQSATPVRPTPPGSASVSPPATPPLPPPAAPPADPSPTPHSDRSEGNFQDRRRNPSGTATPAPAGASSPEASPASPRDHDPPSEGPTQRRPG